MLKRKTLRIGDQLTSYIDVGSGPVVVLLHGAPMTSLGFVRVIESLRHHHRVIAPDFPGFGDSTVGPAEMSLSQYGEFVTAFCEALALTRATFYLNDSSVCIGLAGLAMIPDRVAGLIVADAVPIPLTGRARLVRWVLSGVMGSKLFRAANRSFNILPWLVATVAPYLNPLPPAHRRLMLHAFETAVKRDRILHIFAQMGKDTGFMVETAMRAKQSLGNKPTLILSGQFDPMRLVGGISRYRQMFPNHRVHIVSLEEHFPILASGTKVGYQISAFIAENETTTHGETETP